MDRVILVPVEECRVSSFSSQTLNFLAAELTLALEAANIAGVSGQHIPGKWNTLADWLSRRFDPGAPALEGGLHALADCPPSLEHAKDVSARAAKPRDESFYFLPSVGADPSAWPRVALFDEDPLGSLLGFCA